jgi:hypothetical protein
MNLQNYDNYAKKQKKSVQIYFFCKNINQSKEQLMEDIIFITIAAVICGAET